MKAAFLDVNGCRTRYLYSGEDKGGTPLVLLHGFTDSAQSWWKVMELLGADRPVYAPDMVAHGFTDAVPLDGKMPPELALEYVGAWIAQMGWPEVDIGGSSFGGLVATKLALEGNSKVRRLVILGSGMVFEREEDFTGNKPGAKEAMLSVIKTASAEILRPWTARVIGGKAPDPEPLIVGLMTSYARPGIYEWFEAALDALGDRDAMRPVRVITKLEEIRQPTLILWGRDDPAPWQRAEDGSARIPDALMQVIDDAGHLAHLARPDAVAAAIGPFLDG